MAAIIKPFGNCTQLNELERKNTDWWFSSVGVCGIRNFWNEMLVNSVKFRNTWKSEWKNCNLGLRIQNYREYIYSLRLFYSPVESRNILIHFKCSTVFRYPCRPTKRWFRTVSPNSEPIRRNILTLRNLCFELCHPIFRRPLLFSRPESKYNL